MLFALVCRLALRLVALCVVRCVFLSCVDLCVALRDGTIWDDLMTNRLGSYKSFSRPDLTIVKESQLSKITTVVRGSSWNL